MREQYGQWRGGRGNILIVQQLAEKEQELTALRRKLQVLELSLGPHVPPNFFQPYDGGGGGFSTSEADSDEGGGLSNTDNDGDVSSIGTVHRRRTNSRHDRSSRRHKKSSGRESSEAHSDVRRMAGLKETKERMSGRKSHHSHHNKPVIEENEKHNSDNDSDAPASGRHQISL